MGGVSRLVMAILLVAIITATNSSVPSQEDQYVQIVLPEEPDVEEESNPNITAASVELNYSVGSTVGQLVVTETTIRTTLRRKLYTTTPTMDIITIIWYVATLVVLISFFVVMACADTSRCLSNKPPDAETPVPPTPAPSYRLFAPPTYESVIEKGPDSIFVIPANSNAVGLPTGHSTTDLVSNLENVIHHVSGSDSVRSESTNSPVRVRSSENQLTVPVVRSS
ncbi:uncharacterized protein LOC131691510 [Topomyia yanbarensis]|uniref:uncharacterized protein LOC131691510 n=1 Tax=Topomyia yanbarensis TaxID=2498891 RepID=UPI00273C63DD|nr:uncharacterized protein LOC131691510 [Topomyia yanbarensis]